MRAVREVLECYPRGALTAAILASCFAGKVRTGQVPLVLKSLAELALIQANSKSRTYSA